MSVTQAQYDEIKSRRAVYFGSANGREALRSLLVRTGLFVNPEVNLVSQEGLMFGLSILWELGVLHPENQVRLIEAMGALPMPEIQENE